MKKLLILVGFSIWLVGCAQVSEFTKAQADCASDPTCLAETKKYAEVGKQVAGSVNPVAGAAAGAILTYACLGIFGLRKKKKEEQK